MLQRLPKGCLCPRTFPKGRKINLKTPVEAEGGNCFKFLNYLMEQKCFLKLLREREGQMSLINTDLLRGLGSGRGRESSCLSQCTRSLVWDPGWEVRAGPPSVRSAWQLYYGFTSKQVQWGAGCTPRQSRQTCTNTAELSQLGAAVWKLGGFQKKRAEVEPIQPN